MSRGSLRTCLATLALLAAATESAAAAAAEPRPIDVGAGEVVSVRLRPIYVTVSRGQQRVTGLAREDFRLRRGDREVPIATFESGEVPFTAVVALDSSGSMSGARAALASQAVRSFVAGLRADDEVQVLSFGGHVVAATPTTADGRVLASALDAWKTWAPGSAPYDAVAFATRQLRPRLGRRVLVLVSDGVDLHSVATPSLLLPRLREADVLLYWIRPQPPMHEGTRFSALAAGSEWRLAEELARLPPASSWRSPRQAADELRAFGELVEHSGGRTLDIADEEAIAPALREVFAELRDQYVLGYESDGNAPPEPRLTRRGFTLRSSWR